MVSGVLQMFQGAMGFHGPVLLQNLAAEPRQSSAAHDYDANKDREHMARHLKLMYRSPVVIGYSDCQDFV